MENKGNERCSTCAKYPFCNQCEGPIAWCENWKKRKIEIKENLYMEVNNKIKPGIEKFRKYYFISHCVNCEPNILCRINIDTIDKSRIAEGNAYKTKKEAEKALKKYNESYLKEYGTLIMEDTWKKI